MNRPRIPWYLWLGLLVLLAGEAALLSGVSFVATWFTPIMWTGYILLADGIVYRLRGRSLLSSGRREAPLLILLSVAVWLLFEAYNLHLQNWIYRGLPASPFLRDVGYFWSFATIMPGVFETADLVAVLLERFRGQSTIDLPTGRVGPSWTWLLLGTAMITLPLAVPPRIAAFLFAAVWVGFILMLDPLNERLGLPSVRRDLRHGNWRPLVSYLLAGLACGFIWESWNYQALTFGGAYWVYTVPQQLRITGLHFGQMPIEGLLGFPPFALELRAFYLLGREGLGSDRIFGPLSLHP